mgnify:FL=1
MSSCLMNIESELESWDGKSSGDIEAIYNRYLESKSFLSTIIQLLEIEKLQSGASWLIKHYLEDGRAIDLKQASNILGKLNKLETWEARLHLLQGLPNIPISLDRKLGVEYFLRNNLTSENKFVRAWAYNGFYELSRQYPEYIQETKQFFEMAMKDEAPSVKARIRNIVKKGF